MLQSSKWHDTQKKKEEENRQEARTCVSLSVCVRVCDTRGVYVPQSHGGVYAGCRSSPPCSVASPDLAPGALWPLSYSEDGL